MAKEYVKPKELTPKQSMKYGKMLMNPKTSDTVTTLPKGWQALNEPSDQIQKRRVADRKRTLSRAKAIISKQY
jgi:hypothetical protein